MKVIAITGYKRCGKDTFVKHFVKEAERQGKTVKKLAFANKVKEYIKELYGYSDSRLEEMKSTNEKIKSGLLEYRVRDLMIKAAESLKKISRDSTIWARMTIEEILKNKNYDYIIISDLRFPVEHELLLRNFSNDLIITRIHWSENPECRENPNETYIENIRYDYFVRNEKDNLEPIYSTIKLILKQGE